MAYKTCLLLLCLFFLTSGVFSDTIFQFINNCPFTVWLGANPTIGDADQEKPPDTFEIFTMPDTWSGSLWARTKCSNNASFYFSCETGDCGSGAITCESTPPAFPVTLMNFNIKDSVVFYDLSLIHGYNIKVRIEPDGGNLVSGGTGACPKVDCISDLGNVCPSPMVAKNKDGAFVGCYSSCDAFKQPQFCCNDANCQIDDYSKAFKNLCGLAHTYPGDNSPPVYGCSGFKTIDVTFCPA